jgi:hypothetical protein
MSRYSHLLEKFDGFWRVDIKEAIGRIQDWKPKVDRMKALWFKDAVMEEKILELTKNEIQLEKGNEAAIPIQTEENFYDMPKDICFICNRDI